MLKQVSMYFMGEEKVMKVWVENVWTLVTRVAVHSLLDIVISSFIKK